MHHTSHIILICDGKRGMILCNHTVEGRYSLHQEREFHHDLAASAHEMGSSPPGRTSNRGGPASAVESTDYHEQDKSRFIHSVADEFMAYAATRHEATIIMVAPPKALSVLRHVTGEAFKNRTVIESNKDITKNTMNDIDIFINKIIKN